MKTTAEAAPSKLVTLASAARRVGVSPATAARLAASGEFPPCFWLGARRYLGASDFEKWLACLEEKNG